MYVMCGITGAINSSNSVQIVFEGLKTLEYRGYDSWGIAYKTNTEIETIKQVGKISSAKLREINSIIAIGHTRWATHGKVCLENTHPVLSQNKKISVVHNGIIENFQELKKFLEEKGFDFATETDTETISNLIEFFCREKKFEEAVAETSKILEGRYAFAAIHAEQNLIIGVKNGSPLVLGRNGKEFFIASDANAFPAEVKEAILLEDGELAVLNAKIAISKIKTGKEISLEKRTEKIQGISRHEINAFEHYMLKEIMEQRFTPMNALQENKTEVINAVELIKNSEKVFILGCGTAHKVALLMQYLFSKIAEKESVACISSEFQHFKQQADEKTAIIAVSQSGETADTLEAIEFAKSRGTKIISIINAENTSMHRKSDISIPVLAGQEKAVASTKATTGQIVISYMLAFTIAGNLDKKEKEFQNSLTELSEQISDSRFLEKLQEIAEKVKLAQKIFILGKGLNYPIALESAIKLQEVCYVPAQGFAGGELKHGPLALIESGTPCIVLLAEDETKKDIISNAIETQSRGAYVIGIGSENPGRGFDEFIQVPKSAEFFPLMILPAVQLLAYFVSIKKGINPDYPRNLAKSVTVK